MRFIIAAAAALAIATPAIAQTADAAARRGQTLRDANQARLGTIDRVNADGSVQIIFRAKFVTIPAGTLTVAEGAVVTSLTKADIAKLR